MAGYKNYQVDRNKYTKGIKDIYKKEKKYNKSNEILSKSEKLRNGFKTWTSFYRENMHRFVDEYFGIKLKLFQMILIYLMTHISYFMYLAARGQGKSYIIAVFCCARCVLYPGTKIIIASGTKGQAKLIITQKIEKELMTKYPNLAREIKDVKSSSNEVVVIFHNTSTIEAVTSTDTSRGYRGNILILDEFRLIKEDNLKKVLRPFLNVNRQPPYLDNPKYAHLIEENKEIYISSAWFKNHWIWDRLKAFRNSMLKRKSYFTCALPYQLSVFHGLLSKKRVEEMRTEDDFDELTWLMEMECMFFGESENAFFSLNDIQNCRDLVKPFYPLNSLEFIENKRNKKVNKLKRQEGEIRIIGVDVALMGGDQNDNTVFTCMRLLPNGDNFVKQVPYIESINGLHTEKQAIRLKQLYADFEADYVAMDTNGSGISLYDDCAKILYDQDRDVEYPAWCALNNEEMKKRALDENALPVIFSIKVVKQEVNHEIAMSLKSDFQKGYIKLLVNEIHAKDYLNDKYNYDALTVNEQVELIKPFVQTTTLVNELVNLEYELRSGYVKVKEVGRNRKDRFSSLAYANYYAHIIQEELKTGEDDYDFEVLVN